MKYPPSDQSQAKDDDGHSSEDSAKNDEERALIFVDVRLLVGNLASRKRAHDVDSGDDFGMI